MSGFIDTGPATKAESITPDDDTDIAIPRAIWVGGAGDLTVTMGEDKTSTPVTFASVPAGIMLPIRVKRVLATGTTASAIVALY